MYQLNKGKTVDFYTSKLISRKNEKILKIQHCNSFSRIFFWKSVRGINFHRLQGVFSRCFQFYESWRIFPWKKFLRKLNKSISRIFPWFPIYGKCTKCEKSTKSLSLKRNFVKSTSLVKTLLSRNFCQKTNIQCWFHVTFVKKWWQKIFVTFSEWILFDNSNSRNISDPSCRTDT